MNVSTQATGGSGKSKATDDDFEELVGSPQEQKNWRGIIIAILVIVIVLSLILTAIIIVTPKTEVTKLGDPFTLEDLYDPSFQPRKFIAKWVGDTDTFVYRSREGEVMEYNAATNTSHVIMNNSTFRQLNTDWYSVSEDRQYVLIAYDIQKIYRHSFLARYKIYNRYARDPNSRLVPFPQGSGNWTRDRIQYAGWSPTGNSLTFVYNNNLYYQANPDNTPNWVTNDGEAGRIFNGIPDWVYEEELLHSSAAHWWSPGGAYICYARFDDTHVPKYRFPVYGRGDNVYGTIEGIAYPKAGDTNNDINPRFQLIIMTPNSGAAQKPIPPPAGLGSDYYFTQVAWQDNNHVMVTWSTRAQNKSIYTICDADSMDCHINQVETVNEGKGWVHTSAPIFVGNTRYLMVHPGQDSQYGFWKHIAMVTTPLGSEGSRTYLTEGTWDVLELISYDERTTFIYYLSTNRDPRKRHLFRVRLIDSHTMSLDTPECLTCEYSEECQYVSAVFSPSAKYYILQCLGPGVPHYVLKSTLDDRHIVMEDNVELREKLSKKAIPQREYFEVDVGDGAKVWGYMEVPPILNREHIVQYPTMFHAYGGPGTQLVTEQFDLGYHTWLTSGKSVVYVAVDGRGTGGRGDRWLHSIHGNLGTLEVQDQIKAAEYLRDNYAFIDPERIAIWGWSYGGFVALHALGDPKAEVFTCGVAVAPVTDWRYYDTVYTERYMGLSRENYKGYDNANVSRKAQQFHGKNLMLIHGTADDNVHFQHTTHLMKSLTQEDVDFSIQVYADKDHSISGATTTRHLRRTITQHLFHTCWEGGEPRLPGDDDTVDA